MYILIYIYIYICIHRERERERERRTTKGLAGEGFVGEAQSVGLPLKARANFES